MGLLDGVSIKDYYQGQDLGNYQFVSLDDIITQFQIIYVDKSPNLLPSKILPVNSSIILRTPSFTM